MLISFKSTAMQSNIWRTNNYNKIFISQSLCLQCWEHWLKYCLVWFHQSQSQMASLSYNLANPQKTEIETKCQLQILGFCVPGSRHQQWFNRSSVVVNNPTCSSIIVLNLTGSTGFCSWLTLRMAVVADLLQAVLVLTENTNRKKNLS